MDCRIVLWDSDSSLREALFSRLLRKGFLPVSLGDPGKLAKAVNWLAPELVLFEAGWEKGATVDLGVGRSAASAGGEISLVMPYAGPRETGAGGSSRGLVLDTLRKPFGTRELIGGINSALETGRRIRSRSGEGREWLEIRPLSSADEFEAALALRLAVYRETGFIGDTTRSLEYDSFDSRSVHFGAFIHRGDSHELAGTVRIIRQKMMESSGNGELTRAIRRREPGFVPAIAQDGPGLPSLKTFGLEAGDMGSLRPGFGGRVSATGETVDSEIFEISRLAIAPVRRRRRYGIERRLIQMIVTDSCACSPRRNWFVIAVHPSRRAKFERFGFIEPGDLGVRLYEGLDQPAILMTLDLQQYLSMPNPFSAGLELETLLYRAGGYISHNLEECAALTGSSA